MIRPEEMSKLIILGPKGMSYNIVDRLHKLKIYHIVDHKKSEELDIGSPLSSSDEISEVLVRIRGICSFLGIALPENKISGKSLNIISLKAKVDKLNEDLMRNSSMIKDIDDNLRSMKEKRDTLEKIESLRLSLDSFQEYGSIDYLFGHVEDSKNLTDDLKGMAGRCKGCTTSFHDKELVALFFQKEMKSQVVDKISKRGFSEIDTSFISQDGLKGSPAKELLKLNLSIKASEKKQLMLKKDIDEAKSQWADILIEAESTLSVESEKAEAPLRFGATEEAFIINGWVPTKNLDKVIKDLNDSSKGKIFITSKKIEKGDSVPIKLKHPYPVKNFEWFMDLYTLPSYKEIDPTFLMFLTFPIFYGFMLGDVGYGLVTLGLFLFLRTRIKGDFGRLVNAMIFGSISSIIFGVLFAEYFGVELYHPILVNRLHDAQGLLIMAVAIGAAHVNLGLLVGFYNELRAHGLIAAIFEKLSWILLEISVVITAFAYTDYLAIRPEKWVGFVVMAVSIVMIYKGEGAKGLVEIPAIFSHMLSYARLMAVGLASVILAFVINDLAGGLFAKGIIGILGGTMLLVVGHAINIGLGLISPFLHSLRLHYVEFFTKFYHGGGMRYVPFGAEREFE
ncbi:MAG: V-type ATP synthase subunit I [Nanoarchaeota archaeon]|nr:V-type ATP synthase subunit I [Nanoarchaeota archaeon]